MNKFCLPIIESSIIAILSQIEKHKDKYAYFEIWLDYIENLSVEDLEKIFKHSGLDFIFLFRRKNLELPSISESLKNELFDHLASRQCFIDFDVSTQVTDLEKFKKINKKAKIVTSYHNYTSTPSEMQLGEIAERMHAYDPEVYKFSTFCESKIDAFRLLELQQAFIEKEKQHIVLGMGEHGVITRVFCNLWGNQFWFAPVELQASSAEGQLRYEELSAILSHLSC